MMIVHVNYCDVCGDTIITVLSADITGNQLRLELCWARRAHQKSSHPERVTVRTKPPEE